MRSKQLSSLVLLTQATGLVFFVIFLAAFYLELPSNASLIGNPTFRAALSVFGGLFLILIVVCLAVSGRVRQKN